jgi:hypothetical protein
MLLLEVMDKEPSVRTVWVIASGLGAVGFALARWRTWTIALSVSAIGLFATAIWRELADPVVGPAMRAESGALYGWHAAVACLLALVATCAGRRPTRVDSA